MKKLLTIILFMFLSMFLTEAQTTNLITNSNDWVVSTPNQNNLADYWFSNTTNNSVGCDTTYFFTPPYQRLNSNNDTVILYQNLNIQNTYGKKYDFFMYYRSPYTNTPMGLYINDTLQVYIGGAFTDSTRIYAGFLSYDCWYNNITSIKIVSWSGDWLEVDSVSLVDVTIPNNNNLTGNVKYKNIYSIPLDSVTINLRNLNTNNIVSTTMTDQNGHYEFLNINPGLYKLESEYNETFGGCNATDALLTLIQAGDPYFLETHLGLLNIKAAEVNLSNTITALDALYILLRTVGEIETFPAGDWVFENNSFLMPMSGKELPFQALCVGDVNGSYIPTGLKQSSSISVNYGGIQEINNTFKYSILSNKNAKLGAITLYLEYDPYLFEILNVDSKLEDFKFSIKDNKIIISWFNIKPFNVKDGDVVFDFTIKSKKDTPITKVFNLSNDSELADERGNVINFEFGMSEVITSDFTLSNYPNPFSNSTTIEYTLPESGNVKLTLLDIYGKEITTLVNKFQTNGTYTLNLKLTSGVYLYKLQINGNNKVKKLICN